MGRWWNDIRLKAPRRKKGRTASRSSHTVAPHILLLNLPFKHLLFLLLHLSHPLLQNRRGRLLFQSPYLLHRRPGISLSQAKKTRQRQSSLFSQHQLKSQHPTPPASKATPSPWLLDWCLSASILVCAALLLDHHLLVAYLLNCCHKVWDLHLHKHHLLWGQHHLDQPGLGAGGAPLRQFGPAGRVLHKSECGANM